MSDLAPLPTVGRYSGYRIARPASNSQQSRYRIHGILYLIPDASPLKKQFKFSIYRPKRDCLLTMRII